MGDRFRERLTQIFNSTIGERLSRRSNRSTKLTSLNEETLSSRKKQSRTTVKEKKSLLPAISDGIPTINISPEEKSPIIQPGS